MAEAGLDVVLIDVWAEHVENINTRGLRIVGVGGDRHVKVNNSNQVSCFINNIHLQVRATSDPSQETPVDIVFVQCKAAHTRLAVTQARNMFKQVGRTPGYLIFMILSQSTVFISFQNGLGNEELIAELMGEDRVLGGLTAQGANVEVNIVNLGTSVMT